jgi:signal transduction histidine kinase
MTTVNQNAPANADPNFVPVILAVDDEDSVRLSLRYFLKDKYPNVLFCATSAEAMDVIRRQTVHVAILDIKMVGESGLDLLRLIKSHDPFIECMMLTAFETQENLKEALRRGACDFLHKPPQMHTLLDAVAKAVESRRATERMKTAIARATSLESDLFLMQCGIIHDLRNQITVITGMLALMEHRLSGQTTLDANQVVGLRTELMTAQRGANVCIAMTTRQLDLVRSVASAPDDEMSSLYETAKDIADSLLFHPDARQCTFKVLPPPPALPTSEMPATSAFQLLLNLVLNAAQARKVGGPTNEVTLSFATQHEPLNLAQCVDSPTTRWVGLKTFKNKPPYLRVSVQDKGTGIKPEILPRMFVQNYTTKRTGTGVGLLLVAKLCTDHQILLHVTTQVNVGTTISVYLPTLPTRPRSVGP